MISTAIRREIEGAHRCLVVSHLKPDGDALGSSLALATVLRDLGKEVTVCNVSGVPAQLCFLPGSAQVVRELPVGYCADLALVLDCADFARAAFPLRRHAHRLISIDHHPGSEPFADLQFVDPTASATAVLLYRLFQGWQPLTAPVCQCLYTAIAADTGSFRYSNSDVESFRIAAELVAGGADPALTARHLYGSWSEARLHLLTRALATLQDHAGKRIYSMYVDRDMLKVCACTHEETESFVDYTRSVQGALAGIFLLEHKRGEWRASLRSHLGVDVSVAARTFAGGGHRYAAGATLKGERQEVLKALVAAISLPSPGGEKHA